MNHPLELTELGEYLSGPKLDEVLQHSHSVSLDAGETLQETGHPKDAAGLTVILKGCLRTIAGPSHQRRNKGFFNAGEVLGLYQLMISEEAPITLIAEFPTELLVIDREFSRQLLAEHPRLDEHLREVMHVRISRALAGISSQRFAKLVGFIGNDIPSQALLHKVALRLIERGERVALFGDFEATAATHPPVPRFGLDQFRERRGEFEWTYDRCVLVFPDRDLELPWDLLDLCEEILWCYHSGPDPEAVAAWEHAWNTTPERTQHVRRVCLLPPGERVALPTDFDDRFKHRPFILPRNFDDDPRLWRMGVDRIARHLADVKLGLALAGGGARGFVHLGALRALDRAGMGFDVLSGTSAGALFGLAYASGMTPDQCIDEFVRNLTPPGRYHLLRNGHALFLLANYRTGGWETMLRPYFGDWTLEQLQFPFSTVSVDLVAGDQVVRQTGSMVNAMLESLNLPGIAEPILRDGQALVDGGVLNNLPAQVLRDQHANYVVGIDVGQGITRKFGRNLPGMTTGQMRRAGTLETLFRVLEVMGTGTADLQRAAIDLLIEPDTSAFSFTDFSVGKAVAEVGEAAMEASLPALRDQIDERMRFRSRST